jgi:hypothetical protein
VYLVKNYNEESIKKCQPDNTICNSLDFDRIYDYLLQKSNQKTTNSITVTLERPLLSTINNIFVVLCFCS